VVNVAAVEVVLAVWAVAVAVLFRAVGPRRASLVAILGGLVLLPRVGMMVGPAPFDKRTATGLGLILGVLLFDRRALRGARARWLDLPMAAFALAPLIGLATGGPAATADVVDLAIQRGLGWIVPYIIGRLYFGDAEGARSVAVAAVSAGLVNIPICLYEEAAGPARYLSGLLYGTPYMAGMVDRLGGYRPEGFFSSGLELASWMALTSTLATWLWLGGRWRPRRIPAWLPALALIATTLSCRGVYGYLLLAVGVATAWLTGFLRTRWLVVALLILPVAYIAARTSGAWDGRLLARGADLTGRESTVGFRLAAEDELIRRVMGRDLVFGFGNYVWHSEGLRWPDGQWLHLLWNGGLVGLAASTGALYLVPAALALAHPRGRPGRSEALSTAWGLALWCSLHALDGLHNNGHLTPTALIGGSLVGLYLTRRSAPKPDAPAGRREVADPPRPNFALIATIALLVAIEVLGCQSRGPANDEGKVQPGVGPPRR